MNRKNFIKNSLLSLGTFSITNASSQNFKKDREKLQQVGFNHLPNKEETTMNSVLHKAATRGHANHGWLDAHHTFSFANYYNPERVHFGALRVLNDDIVQGGGGFGTHPHENMEIITIPLEGDLQHKDSMGNVGTIKHNDIQVMSAGTGVFHSEYNPNSDRLVNLLQIWVFPRQNGVAPRYGQVTFKPEDRVNKLQQIVSPNQNSDGMWIHQDAWFYLGKLEEGFSTVHKLNLKGNGIYAFVIEGDVTINGQELNKRDGYGLWDIDEISITANSNAELLLMEVPMNIK